MWFNNIGTKPPNPSLPREEDKKIKCEWTACANNAGGLCGSKNIKLKSVKIDNIDYLRCESFDFE